MFPCRAPFLEREKKIRRKLNEKIMKNGKIDEALYPQQIALKCH